VDRIEALTAKYAETWPAWAYRQIAALMRVRPCAAVMGRVYLD